MDRRGSRARRASSTGAPFIWRSTTRRWRGWPGSAARSCSPLLNGFVYDWGFAVWAGATVWLGGETTCALYYLASERALRPVTALRAGGAPPERHDRPRRSRPAVRRLGAGHRRAAARCDRGRRRRAHEVRRGHRVPRRRDPLPRRGGHRHRPAGHDVRGEGDRPPVTSVRRALERVEDGELDVHVPVDDGSEVGPASGRLQPDGRRPAASASASATCSAVRWARTWRARRSGGHHPPGRRGAPRGRAVRGHRRARRRWRSPCRRPRWCASSTASSAWWSRSSRAEGAIVNKFEGDAAMCVFGAPVPVRRPRRRRAARRPRAGRAPDPRRARARLRHRHLGGHGRGRQRGRRAPLRVHGDRRPGERGIAAVRAGQAAPRARAGVRGRAAGRRRTTRATPGT